MKTNSPLSASRHVANTSPRMQRGTGSTTLLVVVVVAGLILFQLAKSYIDLDATAEELETVVQMAKPSKQATTELAEFLKVHPTPSKSQLSDVQKAVNKIVVREKASAVIANSGAAPASKASPTP